MMHRPSPGSVSDPLALPPPLVVDSSERLEQLLHELAGMPRLAVDTESNSLYAYRERVCLIQLSTDTQDYLVDPDAVKEEEAFGRLGEVFADPAVEKVFHAAEYDVMSLHRDFNFTFAHLFDTMIAARILGWERFGLGSILEERYDVQVNKRFQRANWGRRPLPDYLLRYAQIDTHYLLPLRDDLHALLEAGGHLEEAGELFDEVLRARWNRPDFEPEGFWSIHGARRLNRAGIAVLQELYLYRELQARRRDLPVFKILGDQTLIALAKRQPTTQNALRQIEGISPVQIRRHGSGILRAIRNGQQAPPPPPPKRRRRFLQEATIRRSEALHTWRKEQAAQRGVPSDIVMPKDALKMLAHKAPHTLRELSALNVLGPWRLKTYGAEVLRVIAEADENDDPRK
jgi:ribonuclease D